MKNTLKKVLCTALAAVSLSAMVTVPSSLNKPNSDNAIVNVMEADAKEQSPLMTVRVTKGNSYKLRSGPGKKYSVVGHTEQGEKLEVYRISYDERWYRVTKDSAKTEKWIYAERTHRIGKDSNGKPYHDRIQNYKKESVKIGKTRKVNVPVGAALDALLGQVGLAGKIPFLNCNYVTFNVTPMEERCSDCGYVIRKYEKWESLDGKFKIHTN
ncbi:SH3 domain-containing protein [Ruminococcus flavefaciens]|uniref:SH3 domain-containing protein n=1 Tax=Ruminococcus flavefaciens TaxID=1265 RepID=UPI0026EB2881|nr:SH3 domain-containing protein [Ruminococcus flavefaciens]